jgi:Ran GTPase-activating protein (RanGAP) involved in mRNA processing and transport
MAELAESIARHRHSKEIRLTACGLGDLHAVQMFEALMEKEDLKTLDLASNRLTLKCLPALKALIEKQTAMSNLDVSYNGFGEPGLRILISTLESHPSLRNADFRHCGLTQPSLERLQKLALKRSPLCPPMSQ